MPVHNFQVLPNFLSIFEPKTSDSNNEWTHDIIFNLQRKKSVKIFFDVSVFDFDIGSLRTYPKVTKGPIL